MLEIFENIAIEDESTVQSLPKEYGIDFATGQLTGEIVTGVEAVKVWCFFALKTARYRYRAFSWNYGNEADELIGKNFSSSLTVSELKRMISECLTVHENVESVENISTEFKDGKITAKFVINTSFGSGEIETELV